MATVEITLLGAFSVAVDGATVPHSAFGRRHAAAMVKVLALADGRRLHREQVIDALWPDDTVDVAVPKFHKAAHYARRAIAVPDAVAVRGDQVALCPGHDVVVDAVRFDELARSAVAADDRDAARAALALYAGELLPEDQYDEWAAARRERLRQRHLDLLRFDERWEDVLDLEPGDEAANLALMRRYAAAGDRHAALRQFERLDRTLRTELGVAPGREALALRDRLLATHDSETAQSRDLIGRERELAVLAAAVDDAAAGNGRTVIVSGPPGVGKSALLAHVAEVAGHRHLRIAHGVAAQVEGGWAYAAVVDALADLCRRHPALLDGLADVHRDELDRVLSGAEVAWSGESTHHRLFVAAAELVRLASATGGLLITLDDLHEADDSSLRLLHYLARASRGGRVCIVLAHRMTSENTTLQETTASLLGRHAAAALPLGPLSTGETSALVCRLLDDAQPELVERIVALADGVPYVVAALCRQAGEQPGRPLAAERAVLGGIGSHTREVLQRVAVVGSAFDTDEFVALAGVSEEEAFQQLDRALDAAIIEPASHGYRFRQALVRDALLADVPPHRRRQIHRDAAGRLIELGASPARIGHHLLAAGRAPDAVPYLLRAAETEAALGAYRDALALVDAVRPHATGAQRAVALALRGDLLNAIGDPLAASAYREALDGADPNHARRLRAKLARAAVMSGDLETAAAALDGLEPRGDDADADILLARGNYAFFANDVAMAAAAAEGAQRLVLAGEHNWKVLDLVSLQGFLAHMNGEWFDRMRLELRRTRDRPEIANAIFDGHLCATEYMLYGSTPYAEVIDVGRDLKLTAQRSGALRATAFAAALIGEAALLSGDLAFAEAELGEARDLHRDLGSAAGEALSLLRLAEVRIARDDRDDAIVLLNQALPLARSSMVANHLMQRIFGALIVATADPEQARAEVDRAESTLGWDEVCPFCHIMLAVPAAIACARVGDVEHARRHLAVAERSGRLWAGTSWEAGSTEARAAVAAADGDIASARELIDSAATAFERAGQPLDAARCRRMYAALRV